MSNAAKSREAERIERERHQVCQRCGHERHEHWIVNYAGGSHVSGGVLICPTAIFSEPTR